MIELVGLDYYRKLFDENITNMNSSIILTGSKGIGKFSLISDILKDKLNNIDNLHIIKSEDGKSQIGIEQVRNMLDKINVYPYNDKKHYILIDDADELNGVSFNSILKRLEEPRKTEQFILVTSKLDELSDTIKSRCLIFNMELDSNVISSKLNEIQNPIIRNTLSRIGFSKILEYINNDSVKSKYEDSYNFISDILKQTRPNKLNEYAKQFDKNLDVNLELLKEMCNLKVVNEYYNRIKSNLENRTILIELLLYSIIKDDKDKM